MEPRQPARIYQLRLSLDELRERHSEQFLAPLHATGAPQTPEYVASLHHRRGEVDAVDAFAFQPLVEGVGVLHHGDELAFERQSHGRILLHDGVERVGGLEQLGICQLERGEGIHHVARMVPVVGDA